MASTPTHELHRRWLAELWNGNPSAAHDLVSDDFVGHGPDRETHGPAELSAMTGQTQEMFTTLSFTLEVGPIVEGDLVAGRWTGRGETVDGEVSFFGNAIAGLGEQQRRGRINAVSG